MTQRATRTVHDRYAILSAMANKNCLRILPLLTKERTVSEVIEETQLPQTCVSHCLARLETKGLVVARKEGRFRKYKSTPTTRQLFEALDIHIQGGTL